MDDIAEICKITGFIIREHLLSQPVILCIHIPRAGSFYACARRLRRHQFIWQDTRRNRPRNRRWILWLGTPITSESGQWHKDCLFCCINSLLTLFL